MARDESQPWVRGGSALMGDPLNPADDDYPNIKPNLEGKEYVFEDRIYGTGLPVHVKIVRNNGLTPIKPKQLVSFDNSFLGKQVTGHNAVEGAFVAPADELLPVVGVPQYDLFYVILSGPCLVQTPSTAGVVINKGDQLIGLTAATTGAPDAGKVDLLANGMTASATSTAQLANNARVARNVVGRAMSAATTANTASDLLIYAGIQF